jgi:hypothetical protein
MPAPTDRAATARAVTSILPSRPPVVAPAPKPRGRQIAIAAVLLVLLAVFVIALTMLKR